jgi:hypothetical protein
MTSSTSCTSWRAFGWLGVVQGTAVQREMVPCVQYLLLYSWKTLCGIESRHALPALSFSDEVLMRLVGFNIQQVRHEGCHRGAAQRQRPCTAICPFRLCPDPWLLPGHMPAHEAMGPAVGPYIKSGPMSTLSGSATRTPTPVRGLRRVMARSRDGAGRV